MLVLNGHTNTNLTSLQTCQLFTQVPMWKFRNILDTSTQLSAFTVMKTQLWRICSKTKLAQYLFCSPVHYEVPDISVLVYFLKKFFMQKDFLCAAHLNNQELLSAAFTLFSVQMEEEPLQQMTLYSFMEKVSLYCIAFRSVHRNMNLICKLSCVRSWIHLTKFSLWSVSKLAI